VSTWNNETIQEVRKAHLYPNNVAYYKKPIQLVRAKGSYVWDNEGNEYLDCIGGIVSISVGHNHPQIKEKLLSMIAEDAIQHTTYLYLSQYMANLAKKLAEVAPGEISHSYFTNSGSEANEMAILTAREYTGRQMVVALRHGYHGGTSGPLSLCGHSTWKFPNHPQNSVVHAHAPYCYRCPFKKTAGNCALECANDVKNVIETATSGQIAAFIAEPIMGVGGFIDPPKEYHQKVYEIVKNAGGLYISDEVQAGVGRAGKHFFAIEEQGVQPDIITMAKGIGNGAPVGAVMTKPEISSALNGKLHFNTFGGDPYQAMQAGEVVDIIMNDNLIQNAKEKGDFLKDQFFQMQKDFPIIGDVRGRGLILGLELVKDPKTKEPASTEAAAIMEAAKDQGLLIGKGGLYGNILRMAPSMGITQEESIEFVEKLKKAFIAIQ
jgi:4-aminobutyrate aminotransferase-like enzyme